MEFLTRQIGPLPLWAWGVAIIGGIVVFLYIRRNTNNQSGSTLGQSGNTANTNALNPNNDPNIDPNTGVPYQLEEAVDPQTGVPYYYEQNYGATNSGQAGGTPSGPTAPPTPPTNPGPSGGPPALHCGAIPLCIRGFHIENDPTTGCGHCVPDTVSTGGGGPTPPPPPPQQQTYATITVKPWPQQDSSLSSIWQNSGRGIPWNTWEAEVLKLNPQITNPNLVYPNEQIKVPA